MKRLFVIIILFFLATTYISSQPNAWINEFHYDNTGGDVGEFVEVVIEDPGCYDLADFAVYLYNGNGDATYGSIHPISSFTPGNIEGNFRFYSKSISEIQNGSPDGIAFAYQGTLISGQFLSYEGSFIGLGGPADGITSVDIGVEESNLTPITHSLQLAGAGSQYSDFTWQIPASNTLGSLNNGQSFNGVFHPICFNATAISSEEIILIWSQNAVNDDVMVAYSTDGIFGEPINGTSYSPSDLISGGGEVIYNEASPTFSHISLASNTQYFYRAWSVDGSVDYSSGVSDDATTFSVVSPDLIISEVADPRNPGLNVPDNEKFVEIYNAGTSGVNFNTSTWYLSRQVNAGSWEEVQLTGAINAGETFVIAYNSEAFNTAYGFNADQVDNTIRGNGNDVYALYYGGDQSSGVLIDIYGEINVNGYHTLWDYTDRKAVRKESVTSPNTSWTASEWIIIPADVDPSNNVNELTPEWHKKTLTWEGNNSPDWADPLNWNDGSGSSTYVPDASCNITILASATNNPTVYRRASCNEMIIESDASVTINASPNNSSDTTACFLVMGGIVTNDAGVNGLIVKSDANGDGAFILGANTTAATIERYLSDDKSHFISAPTINATADDLFQNHDPEVYLYEYHEDDETYYYLVPTITPMSSGKGFYTWVDDADSDHIVAKFDGILSSSDVVLSLDYNGSTLGWNLVGNPYPSPLNLRTGSWNFNNAEQTIWIWDPDKNSSGGFVWKTTSGAGGSVPTFSTIPTCQAFFIRSTGTGASLTIPADARTVHHDQLYYKGRDEGLLSYSADYVIIKALNSQDEDEVWISFNEYGTEGFDNGWDASKMFNSYNSVSLYVPKEIRHQCLEHLPALYPDEERIVEIGFETTTDGEHSILIDATYLPDTDITLEDMKYDQMQNMDSDSIYTFVAFADDDPNRFRIHFNKTITGIEFEDYNYQNDESIQIYSYGKHVYIKKEDANTSGYVMLYDMYGREVFTQPLEQTNLMKIPVQLSNSYLVAKVISDSKVFTSKVYIK